MGKIRAEETCFNERTYEPMPIKNPSAPTLTHPKGVADDGPVTYENPGNVMRWRYLEDQKAVPDPDIPTSELGTQDLKQRKASQATILTP